MWSLLNSRIQLHVQLNLIRIRTRGNVRMRWVSNSSPVFINLYFPGWNLWKVVVIQFRHYPIGSSTYPSSVCDFEQRGGWWDRLINALPPSSMGWITPPSRPFESEHRGSKGRKIPTHRRTNSRICLSVWDVFHALLHAQIECDRVVCTWYLVWPPTTQWRVCSSKSHIHNESHMSSIKSIKSEIIRLLVEDINLVPPTTQSWVFQHIWYMKTNTVCRTLNWPSSVQCSFLSLQYQGLEFLEN